MKKAGKQLLSLTLVLCLCLSFGAGIPVRAQGLEGEVSSSSPAAGDTALASEPLVEGEAEPGEAAPEDTPAPPEEQPPPEEEAPPPETTEPEEEASPPSLAAAEAEEAPAPDVEALLQTARADGTAAAAIVNGTADEELHASLLAAVLDLYYGEVLYDRLAEFASASDARADETLQRYARAAAERDDEDLDYLAGQVIVVFKPEVDEPEALAVLEEQNVMDSQDVSLPEEEEVSVVADISLGQTVADAVEELNADPKVEYAQPNYAYTTMEGDVSAAGVSVNDPGLSSQWYLDAIYTQDAWDALGALPQREPVKVAVLDTPVDTTHADLQENVDFANARDFQQLVVDGTYPTIPDEGRSYPTVSHRHGTHVTGTIAATAGNNLGVTGVATGPDNQFVEVLPLNVFTYNTANADPYKAAYSTALKKALIHAADNGAKVVNMSLGGPDNKEKPDTYMQAGIDYAVSKGVTVVAAAGNDGSTAFYTPSDFEKTISVIALNRATAYGTGATSPRASFSNYSGKDIAAPGVDIYNTVNVNDYLHLQGTSMASPIVAGVAAMMLYADPTLLPENVKAHLQQTATDVFTKGYDEETSYGAVNAGAAVDAVVNSPWLPSPRNFRSTGRTQNSISLAWDTVDGAQSYEIHRRAPGENVYSLLDTVTTASCTDTTITQSGAHSYLVLACATEDENRVASLPAGPISIYPSPGVPTLTATSETLGNIQLEWSAVPDVGKYEIYRTTTPNREDSWELLYSPPYILTSYIDSGGAIGETVYYKVRARQDTDTEGSIGDFSQPAHATRVYNGPALSFGRTSGSSITLRWTGSDLAANYLVYHSTEENGDYTLFAETGSTVYEAANLALGQTHWFYVQEQAPWGTATVTSSKSNSVSILAVPEAPSPEVSREGYGSITLGWKAVPGADGYVVYRKTHGYGTDEDAAGLVEAARLENGVLSYTDCDYWPTVTYTYTVAAYVNKTGGIVEGVQSKELARTCTAAPQGLEAAVTAPGSLQFTWENPLEHTLSYRLEKKPTDAPDTAYVDAANESFTVADLGEDAYYSFRLKAINNITGQESEFSAPVVANAAVAPKDLVIEPAGYNALSLRWTGGAARYAVYRAKAEAGPYTLVAVSSGATHTDTGLADGEHFYRVYTLTAGDTRSTGYASGSAASRPAALVGLTCAPEGLGTLRLNWQAVPGASGYTVKRDGAAYKTVKGNVTTLLDAGLAPRQYSYTVEAYRTVKKVKVPGDADAVTGTPLFPRQVQGFEATSSGPHMLRLSWDLVPGATGYRVYRAPAQDGKSDDELTYTLVKNLGAAAVSYEDKAAPGGSFVFKICALMVERSKKVEGEPAYAPLAIDSWAGAPENFAATPINYYTLLLTWDEVPGAQGYYLYLQQPGKAEKRLASIAKTRARSYTHVAQAPQEGLSYRVVAWAKQNNKVVESPSATLSGQHPNTLSTAELQPSAALAGVNAARVSWRAAPDAAGYRVRRTAYGAKTVDKYVKAETLQYTDKNLAADFYFYEVSPYYMVGRQRFVEEGAATDISIYGLPSPEVFDAVSTGTNAIKLSWKEVTNNTYGTLVRASGYQLWRKGPDDANYKLLKKLGRVTQYTDRTAPTGEVSYRLIPLNGSLAGVRTTLDTNVEGLARASFAVESTKVHAAAISWSEVKGASWYRVQRATSQGGSYTTVATVAGTKRLYNDAALEAGEYWYRVTAMYKYGTAKLPGETGAAKQVLVKGVQGIADGQATPAEAHRATLSWGSEADATGYYIYTGTAGSQTLVATVKANKRVAQMSATVDGLPAGNLQFFIAPYYTASKKTFTDIPLPMGDAVTIEGLTLADTPTAEVDSLLAVKVSWQPVTGAGGYVVRLGGKEVGRVTGQSKTSFVHITAQTGELTYSVTPWSKAGKAKPEGYARQVSITVPSWEDELAQVVTATLEDNGAGGQRLTTEVAKAYRGQVNGFVVLANGAPLKTIAKNTKAYTTIHLPQNCTKVTLVAYRSQSGQRAEATVTIEVV